ncbi:lipopolysaccharide core heptose(I) kinase RfaP [Propionivibrio sp.]|uniref:lipopolysaccharide core heptose(I) kinase RfaP n=1 Tax=Propionivibrio sp. TaxID=2212460 RepID=UPI0025FC4888|nr:lipopolysaccharide core heptose(I) kinase RfaP [Propionivibrio sp.]MBK7355684.1 lipopolysaccharide core heptose(I) kinase RfaP [Propionivibrio sp.]MBK8400651.1 lipopolysaccharide core heptose(I) kinase RfaP [Propionivibrio sp.]MBK8745456.1 lipopolysaccharide core heptose(I) kinase RfaP [Propionivibrio sp.]MBK8893680.1 lipopolysaccharide core heptose(I) kinase RfaP [Propionivibrio sp.]MBL0207010.1 lipopolysaccharide core heptose(I) kinase RfaP [Propionivibrio sp.]
MSAPLLVIDEPFRTLWHGRDPFAAVEALEGELYRELAARRTLRFEVAGRGYFVKIHRGVGWAEILKNLLILRLPVLGALNEWLAIKRLGELGVDTMHSVAFGQSGSNPASRHSFIVTEALAPTISLEDFCRDWPVQPPPLALKRALIRRVAEMAERMHRGGVNHRDFYLCHFLLHQAPVPTAANLKLSIIDLHRAQLRRETPRRWRDKDLASLYFSALEIGLTQHDLLRFLRIYFGRTLREILRDETRLLAYLVRDAERLRLRYLRKFSNSDS